jgi:hypothetical protein
MHIILASRETQCNFWPFLDSHLLGMLCSWRTSFIPQLLLLAANIFPSQGFASVKGNVMAVAEQKAAAEKQGALAVLSEHLYAFTFVPADNPNAMTQWLRHYIRAIGVRPAHIGMAILTGRLIQTLEPTGALNLTLAALHSHGVSRGQVNIIRGANYSDLLRLQVVNEHISKVVQSDPQAWYIFADADEHFYYDGPAMRNLTQAVAKYDCFWGLFCDMRSADGNMSEMVVDVPAAVQYPVACRVRQLASKYRMRSNKVILFRVRSYQTGLIRDYRSPHAITETRDQACQFRDWHAKILAAANKTHMAQFRYQCRSGDRLPHAQPLLPPPQVPQLPTVSEPSAGAASPPPTVVVNRSTSSMHASSRSAGTQCRPFSGTVRHYTMTYAALLMAKDKADWDLAHPHATWGDSFCGNQARNGVCRDYQILYSWMRRQNESAASRKRELIAATERTKEDKMWCPDLPVFPYCFTMNEVSARDYERG